MRNSVDILLDIATHEHTAKQERAQALKLLESARDNENAAVEQRAILADQMRRNDTHRLSVVTDEYDLCIAEYPRAGSASPSIRYSRLDQPMRADALEEAE